jgi:gamma-glutamyl hercynylcysteine S-oxide synthase
MVLRDGVLRDGVLRDGVLRDGVLRDGVLRDGVLKDGTVNERALKELAAVELGNVRQRTLDLLDPLGDDELIRQHSPLMSPLVWDLAHVGNYEELWLVREAGGLPPLNASLDDLYDAFRHARPDRPSLPLLGPADARRYIGEVRERSLDVIDAIDFDPDFPLLANAFVVGLVIQHEHQHDETMLATLQLMKGAACEAAKRSSEPKPGHPTRAPAPQVLVAGGPFDMGTDESAWAYDNERPAHPVELPPFWIDAFPVTNGQYEDFIADGGYQRPDLWTPAGWAWRMEAGLECPQFWHPEGQRTWSRVRFGWIEELPVAEPVQHVCWYEADAYARWAGLRLPTEAEWEKAAQGSVITEANLGGSRFGPEPVGTRPAAAGPSGAQHMLGDVWEWTSSDFLPYPGFVSFPYREYSEVFFGADYKVLRGGSWASDPTVARVTFRNWDYPIRRQIFAGFRCVRDA